MKIPYASDLHLEFAENRNYIDNGGIEPVGDVLVLAGDVSYLGDRNMMKLRFWNGVRSISGRPLLCRGIMSSIMATTLPRQCKTLSMNTERMCDT